jgi:hypothetical protein
MTGTKQVYKPILHVGNSGCHMDWSTNNSLDVHRKEDLPPWQNINLITMVFSININTTH